MHCHLHRLFIYGDIVVLSTLSLSEGNKRFDTFFGKIPSGSWWLYRGYTVFARGIQVVRVTEGFRLSGLQRDSGCQGYRGIQVVRVTSKLSYILPCAGVTLSNSPPPKFSPLEFENVFKISARYLAFLRPEFPSLALALREISSLHWLSIILTFWWIDGDKCSPGDLLPQSISTLVTRSPVGEIHSHLGLKLQNVFPERYFAFLATFCENIASHPEWIMEKTRRKQSALSKARWNILKKQAAFLYSIYHQRAGIKIVSFTWEGSILRILIHAVSLM